MNNPALQQVLNMDERTIQALMDIEIDLTVVGPPEPSRYTRIHFSKGQTGMELIVAGGGPRHNEAVTNCLHSLCLSHSCRLLEDVLKDFSSPK